MPYRRRTNNIAQLPLSARNVILSEVACHVQNAPIVIAGGSRDDMQGRNPMEPKIEVPLQLLVKVTLWLSGIRPWLGVLHTDSWALGLNCHQVIQRRRPNRLRMSRGAYNRVDATEDNIDFRLSLSQGWGLEDWPHQRPVSVGIDTKGDIPIRIKRRQQVQHTLDADILSVVKIVKVSSSHLPHLLFPTDPSEIKAPGQPKLGALL
jgi:hypothetical protein